jgi:hypothetical protein
VGGLNGWTEEKGSNKNKKKLHACIIDHFNPQKGSNNQNFSIPVFHFQGYFTSLLEQLIMHVNAVEKKKGRR